MSETANEPTPEALQAAVTALLQDLAAAQAETPPAPHVPRVVYEADEAGRIRQCIVEPISPAILDDLVARGARHVIVEGEATADFAVFSTHWIDAEGRLLPRPALPAVLSKTTICADGVDTAVVTGLPSPSSVTLEGPGGTVVHTVTDGRLEIATATSATWRVAVEAWPHLPWTAEVTAR